MPLWSRDSVSTTFSSWDNCMQKAYCKWPVISAIIVGSLIVLSLLGCLVSCVCCGVQCCRGCCCCCPSGRSRNPRPKYADYSTPYDQLPPPPNMNYGAQPPPAAPTYQPPQRAQFDASRIDTSRNQVAKVDDDALPPMPTWAEATTKRVENTSSAPEAVEMNPLSPPSPNTMSMAGGELLGRVGYGEVSPPHSPLLRTHSGYRPLEQQQQQSYIPQSSYRQNSPYESQAPAQTLDIHPLRPYDQPPSPVSPTAGRPTFSPYERQPQSPYQTYSPPIPSSPPPPFSTTADDMTDTHRPPSLLQVGRKPVANSWRNV